MQTRTRIFAVTVAVLVLSAACTDANIDDAHAPRTHTPSPSSSPTNTPLCQPFPDRLIDEFLAAYNAGDSDALKRLVVARPVQDLVAAAYSGDSSFDDVTDWGRANLQAGDRMRNVGYSAFHPTKNGFQMLLTRKSAVLRDEGIPAVSVALNAVSSGCTITSLESAGPVQAEGDPCAFYDAFQDVADIAAREPRVCRDGSAEHARTGPLAVLAHDEVLIWGGRRGGFFDDDLAMDGLAFNFQRNRWRRIPAPQDMPPIGPGATAWTGSELLVAGTAHGNTSWVVVAGYAPKNRSWRRIAFPYKRAGGFEAVWTGRELLLWGGPDHSAHPVRRGLLYNPVTDMWLKTSPAPVSGRWSHSVAWTGRELIVWGGGNANTELADGAAYNPASDTWREIAQAPLSSRQWMPLVWTGEEVIVWGGSSISRSVADGAAYNPIADSWRKIAPAPLRGRYNHSAIWTGSEMIVFGGYNYKRAFADGAAYDPTLDRWRKLSDPPLERRFDHAAMWAGTEMMIFGGMSDFGHIAFGDGGLYDPSSDAWRRLIPDVP